MITAKQAKEGWYNKTLSWCEKNLQPKIESVIQTTGTQQKKVSRLFWDYEVNPNELKSTLEQHGFKVELINMTEISGLTEEHGIVYNVTVRW